MPAIPDVWVQSVLPERGQPGSKPILGEMENIHATPEMFGAQVGVAEQKLGGAFSAAAIRPGASATML